MVPFLAAAFADKRKAEAARIKEKYPDRIPVSAFFSANGLLGRRNLVTFGSRVPPFLELQVIVEKAERSDIPDIDKKK